ncbi:MAG: hypothetical protein GX823_01510, partial [Clostridiales bacterium]|nr:hypothetical protein [Clostridiales bacterium]
MRKLFSKRLLRRTLAVMFAMVMVMPLLAISASADEVLATPVLIQKGENTDTPGSPGNPAKHTQFRSLIFNPVEGATGYNVYAYATKADAEAQENAVAVAENVGPTIESTSTGGTMGQIPMVLEDDEVLIDVRLIGFSDLDDSGATRDLPEGYTPAGLGDTYYPGDGTGNTTNLKPGQYW